MSSGTAQGQRFPPAPPRLAAAQFGVDDMPLHHLIAMSAGLADTLRFVDPGGAASEHGWSALFEGDESLLLACIASFDRRRSQAKFVQLWPSAPASRLVAELDLIADQLDAWYGALARIPGDAAAAVALRELIKEVVRPELRTRIIALRGRWTAAPTATTARATASANPGPATGPGDRGVVQAGAGRAGPLSGGVDERLWSTGTPTEAGPDAADTTPPGGPPSRPRSALAGTRRRTEGGTPDAAEAAESAEEERGALRASFFSLLSAVARVQARALALLPQTLASGRHAPAAGLLLSFLRLYATVQGRINTFTDRHIDFYYLRCLGLQPRPAEPDGVHVVCRAAPHAALPVLVPAGTRFAAGKDSEGRPIEFRAGESLLLGDARVARLSTLRMERDPLISPEADLGYVTRARASRLPMEAPPELAWPLFGGMGPGGFGPGSLGDAAGPVCEDAALGLALASPVLLLGEGEREVEVRLRLGWPEGTRRRLVQAAVQAATPAAFRTAFGRLFAHWLLCADGQPLAVADRDALQSRARALGIDRKAATPHSATPSPGEPEIESNAGDPLQLLWGAAEPDRDLVFDRLLRDTLEVHFTVPTGWLAAAHLRVARARSGGLRILAHLHPGDAAVVGCQPAAHGAQWPTRLPLMRLQTTGGGRMFPYSLLDGAALLKAEIQVRVLGVRNVLLYNNLGRLDPSKAFNPFGPLPTLSSYLVFGAPEAAAKNLDRMVLTIDWGGLPRDLDGFDTYYASYGPEQVNGAHRVSLAVLGGGQWHGCGGTLGSAGAEGGQVGGNGIDRRPRDVTDPVPLFAGLDADRRLRTSSRIEVDPSAVRTFTRASHAPLEYGLGARDGFFRLQLAAPAGAFGHAVYPQILAAAVTPPRWGVREAKPLPNPPYTPLIEGLALDYSAHSTIEIGRVPAAAEAEQLFHQHPFGVAPVVAAASGPPTGVLPHIDHDGNLYVGLDASTLEGPLTLLFDLVDEGTDGPSRIEAAGNGAGTEAGAEDLAGRAVPRWAAMRANGWQALAPSQVLSDSTSGFLGPGIVSLDLPPTLVRNATVLDPGLFWLRAAADHGLDGVAQLRGVHAQALTLYRAADPAAVAQASAAAASVPASAPASALALGPGRITGPRAPIAGLAAVTQLGPSFGLRPAESAAQLRVRAGERLRHKGRASLAWDTERMVLEEFPEVFKVKCLTPEESGLGVGQILVVVVPALRPVVPADHARALQLSPVTLARIRDFLGERVSAFARVRVRNVAYERVQVRCQLVLQRAAAGGRVLQRVEEAILEQLSPWRDPELGPSFDWTLRCDDVTERLRQVEGVEEVATLALLGVARSDRGDWRLHDSALPGRRRSSGGPGRLTHEELHAQVPWSIALPMSHHLVGSVPAPPDARPKPVARPAGIGLLEVGSTLVVGGSD